MKEAVVVFTGDNAHWFGPLLKRGCRHVFAIIPSPHDDATSIIFDCTTKGLDVRPVAGTPRQCSWHYGDLGYETIVVPYTPHKRTIFPLLPNTCVTYTKHVIGLRTRAMTPWQLRRHLKRLEIEPFYYQMAH